MIRVARYLPAPPDTYGRWAQPTTATLRRRAVIRSTRQRTRRIAGIRGDKRS